MKIERITLLGSTEFKSFLALEAAQEGVSVSELVRRRCERLPTDEEALLSALAAKLHTAVLEAKASLSEGLDAVDDVLEEARISRMMSVPK